MKKLYFLLFLLPMQIFAQQNLNWSDTQVVSHSTPGSYFRPRIAMANNTPVVIWGKGLNQSVFSAHKNGSNFSSANKLTPEGVNAFVQNWAGPEIGAAGNVVYVAFKSQPEDEGFVYVVRSTDGGANFSDTIRVSNKNWSRFSTVGVAPSGKPFVSFMEFNEGFGEPRWVVSTSNNGGNSFAIEVESMGSAPGEACDCCPGFIGAENDNYVYTLFRNNDNNLRDIWASVSTNNGASFNTSADVDATNWKISVCPSTGPDAFIAGDSIIAVWISGGLGSSKIHLAVMHKNTLVTGTSAMLTPGASTMANQNYPRIAGKGNVIGVVWQESMSGKTIVKFLHSTTGPQGLLNKTPDTVSVNLAGTQRNPDIEYADGVFHIVWQDDNKRNVIYRTAAIPGFVGINEPDESSANIKIYPNPANDLLTIEIKNPASKANIIIADVTGKVVFKEEILSSTQKINTQNLPAGIYILTVSGNGFLQREKIIISR